MKTVISLGFSCQTRFAIDALFPDPRRHPFDFTLATRDSLLEALSSAGANFVHDAETATLYRMTVEGRQGVCSGGLCFWHDYPVDKEGNVQADWPSYVEKINDKYGFLWSCTKRILSDPNRQKVFVCSNTQENLTEFTADAAEFHEKFALDLPFAHALHKVIGGSGISNYSLQFLNRSLRHAHDFARLGSAAPARNRFWGPVTNSTNAFLAAASLLHRIAPHDSRAALGLIAGRYVNNAVIHVLSDDIAYVYQFRDGAAHPWAEVTALETGYLFVFDGGSDRFFTAVQENDTLVFSNNTEWRRA